MIIKLTKQEKVFKPYTIELTFETKADEDQWFDDLNHKCLLASKESIMKKEAYELIINQISQAILYPK